MNASGLICASSNTSIVGGTSGFPESINSRSIVQARQYKTQEKSMDINNTDNIVNIAEDTTCKHEEFMHDSEEKHV